MYETKIGGLIIFTIFLRYFGEREEEEEEEEEEAKTSKERAKKRRMDDCPKKRHNARQKVAMNLR